MILETLNRGGKEVLFLREALCIVWCFHYRSSKGRSHQSHADS